MAKPEDNMNYIFVSEIPPGYIVNRAYNASKQIQYLGHAKKGTANATSIWTIREYTYTSSQVTSERVAHNVAWDDRATATYD